MRRVMIIGCSGSGKSTTARKLGDITGLPVTHIDTIFWQPGWLPRSYEDFRSRLVEITATDHWIIDGNYSSSFDERLARADTLVFLDLSTIRRTTRVLRRTIAHYGKTRIDLAEGCLERFDWHFTKFVVGYRWNGHRQRALDLLARTPERIKIHHLHSHLKFAISSPSPNKSGPEGAA